MNAKRFFQLLVTMILFLMTALPQSVDAQTSHTWSIDAPLGLEQKLTAPDGEGDDYFGVSIAFSGDTAWVGAFGDDIASKADQGSAYVFVRDGGNWIMQQKLTAPDGEAGDGFGISVAISGDTAIVGAFLDDIGANTNQGSAYVFTRSGTTWTFQQKLTASAGAAEDRFGHKVAISGDTALMGSYADNVGTNIGQGSAYVFIRSGTTWSEQQQLIAPDGEAGDGFGYSVAISGDTAIIGAYHDTVKLFSKQGSAYVFTRSGTTWSLQQQLVALDGVWDDYFGVSVALSGDTALVGASGAGSNAIDQGSAYVFIKNGTTWSQQQKLEVPGAEYDNFGNAVALSGDTALVASYLDDINAKDQGSAYAFIRSGTIWTLQQRLIASDGDEFDVFGVSVALSANKEALVGAYYDTVGTNYRQGSVYFLQSTFVDVPFTHPYYQDIEILYANGLTAGCLTSPLKFCPDQIMNRGQAAVFMLRGNFGSSYVPPVPAHIFKDDWSKGTWAEPWAEGMYYEGLSAGCLASPLKYCPWAQIPREQAVIFALRMKYGMTYTPPPATGTVFADMTDPGYYATSWAEQAYKDGLIPNCGTSGGKPKFCPKNLVSRGLAAYMIVRAKNLTMP